jgi:type II secretory pathway pseudopilin PulG
MRGFTLIAIVVTVMIIAVIAAVAVPYLTESTHEMSAVRTAQILRTLELDLNNTSATNGPSGFCATFGLCPQLLHDLTVQIQATELEACNGNAAYGGITGTWPGNAPYSGLPIAPGNGVWTPLGVIHDSVVKTSNGNVELHIDSLTLNDAINLDIAVDGSPGTPTTGQLTYAATPVNTSGQTLELAKYLISVGAGTCK